MDGVDRFGCFQSVERVLNRGPLGLFAYSQRGSVTSPSEFRTHYENSHMPLFPDLFGVVYPLSHTRFNLQRTSDADSSSDNSNSNYRPTVIMGAADDFTYEVYARLAFEDEAALQVFYPRMREPEVAAKIAEDEGKFMVRQLMKVAVVAEPVVTTRSSL